MRISDWSSDVCSSDLYEDLAGYRGRVETPTMTSVFGYEVYKAGFWSQGPAMLMALNIAEAAGIAQMEPGSAPYLHTVAESIKLAFDDRNAYFGDPDRSEEHTSELQSLMRISYAVFCLKKHTHNTENPTQRTKITPY